MRRSQGFTFHNSVKDMENRTSYRTRMLKIAEKVEKPLNFVTIADVFVRFNVVCDSQSSISYCALSPPYFAPGT